MKLQTIILLLILPLVSLFAQTGFIRNMPESNVQVLEQIRAAAVRDAEADIAKGRVMTIVYGLPPDYSSNMDVLLWQRYGIRTAGGTGCDMDPGEAVYYSTYNERSEKEITRRFGGSIFDSVRVEAQRLYENGIMLEDSTFHYEHNEPYAITVDPMPAFPESLIVKGTFGDIDLSIDVLKNGVISNASVSGIILYRGPYKEDYLWPPDDSTQSDSIMPNIKPWLDQYIASMHAQIKPEHFYWMYRDTLSRGYRIQVNPHLDNPQLIKYHVPEIAAPDSLVGPEGYYRVVLSFWVKRTGEMAGWRIGSILQRIPNRNPAQKQKWSWSFCSSEGFEDSARSYTGATFLIERYRPWIESIVPKITFDVDQQNEYFKYFDVKQVRVSLESKGMVTR